MLEQELKDIWKNSSQVDKIKFDLSRLMIDLNRKLNEIERNIRSRDRRESGAAIVGVLIFAYFGYVIPFPITKIACILAIAWSVYVIYKLKSVQKYKRPVDISLSFREQLENQRIHISQQVKLLNSVLYWYVLPPFIMNIIFIMGLGDPQEYDWAPRLVHLIPVTLKAKLSMLGFIAAFNVFIVWLNKYTVRKTLKPLIKDIERVQHQLETEE